MYKNILFAVDLHDELSAQRKPLEIVNEYAQAFGSTVHVVTVLPDFVMRLVGNYFQEDFEEKALLRAAKDLDHFVLKNIQSDIKTVKHLGHGVVYKEIIRTANDVHADLIIMGSHRPELRDYLLGPNASSVVRHAQQSVLVVRPE